MKIDELSRMYFIACDFINDATIELYESLHESDGSPKQDHDAVKVLVDNYSKQVKIELELIRAAIKQHSEGH